MTVLHNGVYMQVVKQKYWYLLHQPGPRLDIKKTSFPGMHISILKIRR